MSMRSVIVGLFCTVKRWCRRRIKPVSISEGARIVVRVEPEFQINAVGGQLEENKDRRAELYARAMLYFRNAISFVDDSGPIIIIDQVVTPSALFHSLICHYSCPTAQACDVI